MNYIFGSTSRAQPYIKNKKLLKLNFINIFFLKKSDVLYVTRSWSLLIELISVKKNRPKIIILADGLITKSNCVVRHNSYHLPLFQKINGDLLLVRQNLSSLPNFIPKNMVSSIIKHDADLCSSTAKKVVLIFGNDPYVGMNHDLLIKKIYLLSDLLSNQMKVYFSCGNKSFKNTLINRFPNFINIGQVDGQNIGIGETVFITTPSTASYDLFLKGAKVLYFSDLQCETIKKLYKSTSSLHFADGNLKFQYKKCKDIENIEFYSDKVRKVEALKIDIKSIYSQVNIFKPFVLQRLLGDLKQLFLG